MDLQPGAGSSPPERADRLARAGSSLVFGGLLIVVAVLTFLGTPLRGTPDPLVDLDREGTLVSLFSSLLLGWCAWLAFSLARVDHARRAGAPVAALVLAAVLVEMAFDEAMMLHERLGGVAGLPWAVWYSPVLLAGVVAGWRVARAHPPARRLFALALGVWIVSGLMETVFWGPDPAREAALSVTIEELCEMLGMIALACGLLRSTVLVRPGAARRVPAGQRASV